MKRPNNYCPNRKCSDFGKKGHANLTCYGIYGLQQTKLLCCRTCGTRFSERRNTLFFGLHSAEDTIKRVIRCWAEGKSIRVTAKQIGISKDTVHRIYERADLHCQRVLTKLMRELQLENYPLEDLRYLLAKKMNKQHVQIRNTVFDIKKLESV